MNKVLLLINTIKYLKLRQILWRLYYTFKRKFNKKTKVYLEDYSISIDKTLEPFVLSSPSYLSENNFVFLNSEHIINSWNDSNREKLWLYNVHYFDYLMQVDPPDESIICKWIDENPIGHGNGWEPYPISLRVVNWMKYHLVVQPLDKKQLDSLFLQVKYLSENIEYHILGNHLFENAKALLIGGLFFKNDNFLRIGNKILQREIKEQILDDGAHFELSPMYHAIVLEGMLDIVNFCNSFEVCYPNEWIRKIHNMIQFHLGTLHPDGDISYFNDSTLGTCKKSVDLMAYAKRLGFSVESVGTSLDFSHSGFVHLRNNNFSVLFKCGGMKASYIPGHAHADLLSFELSCLKERVFVNTGVSTYKVGHRRELERSTQAHNTVEINGTNQSEVWSSFRVARRVSPEMKTVLLKENLASCSYSGKLHRRTIRLKGEDKVIITDQFSSKVDSLRSYLHLHPSINVKTLGNASFELSTSSGNFLMCKIKGADSVDVQKFYWSGGFNKLIESSRIVCYGQRSVESIVIEVIKI